MPKDSYSYTYLCTLNGLTNWGMWIKFYSSRQVISFFLSSLSTFPLTHDILILVHLSVSSLFTGVFYYLNSSVNPVLYSVMSTRFRAAFSLYVSDFCSNSSSSSDRAGSSRIARPPTVIRAPKSLSDHHSSHKSIGDNVDGGTRTNIHKQGINPAPPIGPVALTVSPGDVHWSKNPNYFQA